MINIDTNLKHKYKDRQPLETVDIIQKFFIKQGYQIQIIENEQSKGNTFWCRIVIKNKNNKILLGANGKGATREYSLASGHAELYERYCNKFHMTHLDRYKYFHKNKLNYNYFYEEDEKFLSFFEILNSSSRIKNAINYLDGSRKNYYLKTFALLYDSNEKLPCSYFFNLDPKKDGKYFNEDLILTLTGSDGAAAGNTLEEAIVQGLSEVYEHYVTEQIFKNTSIQYYELNLNNIKLPSYIIKMLYNIKNNDNIEYHFFDLSYNFNMPVILGTYHDKDNNTWSIDLGAHPVFEIALERTITEQYQGTNSLKNKKSGEYILPFRNEKNINTFLLNNAPNLGLGGILPEFIFLNSTITNNFNNNIFLKNKNYTNSDLINYFLKINKNNNFDVYVKDVSQDTDIKAIKIFVANQDIFSFVNYDNTKKIIKYKKLKYNYNIAKIIFNFLQNEQFDYYNYKKLKNKLKFLNKYFYIDKTLNFNIDPWPFIDLSSSKNFYDSLKNNLFILTNNEIKKDGKQTIYLYEYLFYKNYSLEEILTIFKNILLIDSISLNDINNITNIKYQFDKIFLKNFIKEIKNYNEK